MARPRSSHTEKPEAESVEEPKGKTVKLKYDGPSGQVVAGLGVALEPGESYDVPEEMAEGLLAGSVFWSK